MYGFFTGLCVQLFLDQVQSLPEVTMKLPAKISLLLLSPLGHTHFKSDRRAGITTKVLTIMVELEPKHAD